jgi:pimeloyl-ACP methyl ester carboxylesterase
MPDATADALNELVPGGVSRGGVRLGERTVRWAEAGGGHPTVVLEAGRDDTVISWAPVMAALAGRVHVVAYDRAGLGASDPAPAGNVIERQVADLAAVIGAAADGPCVVAGHSWGGMLAQLLAFRHPALVSGLVLVDPAHEGMAAALSRPARWLTKVAMGPGPVRSVILTSGMLAPVRNSRARRTAELFSTDPRIRALVAAAYAQAAGRPDELALAFQGDGLQPVWRLRAAAAAFPDIPVIVLSATRGFPPRLRAYWTELQADLAAAAPRGRHVVATGSGHAIHLERTGLVVDAITEVAGEARRARGGAAAQ